MEPGSAEVRLARMHTRRRSGAPLIGPCLALLAILAACSSAAAPTSSSSPSQSAPPSQSASPSTSQPPGGAEPDPVAPDAPTDRPEPGVLPGDARVVVPKPGQFDVRPIPAQTLSAQVDGRRVVIAIDYTSGVEPCYVLDSILVQPGPGSFAITLREGHGAGDVMCIEIAEFKRALVDLGDLEPGTYTISDTTRGATPISVTVS